MDKKVYDEGRGYLVAIYKSCFCYRAYIAWKQTSVKYVKKHESSSQKNRLKANEDLLRLPTLRCHDYRTFSIPETSWNV